MNTRDPLHQTAACGEGPGENQVNVFHTVILCREPLTLHFEIFRVTKNTPHPTLRTTPSTVNKFATALQKDFHIGWRIGAFLGLDQQGGGLVLLRVYQRLGHILEVRDYHPWIWVAAQTSADITLV